jgi:hemoglobin
MEISRISFGASRRWRTLLRRGVMLLALCIALIGCARQERATDDLYQALQQRAGIDRMVKAIFDRVYADPRIAPLFRETDRPNLEMLVAEQICMEAGGPCEYTGRSMEESHSGFGLTHKDFDAFVEDFILGMEDSAVSYRTQNRVLRIFAPMREQMIDK